MRFFKVLLVSLFISFIFIFQQSINLHNLNEDSQDHITNPQSLESTNQVVDIGGNLLMPFDLAFPERFNSDSVQYESNHLLLKFSKDFDGRITRNLKSIGYEKIELFSTSEGGDWYRAYIQEDKDIHHVMAVTRTLNDVIMADYNYIYQAESITNIPLNPRVSEQWYLQRYGIPEAWQWMEDNGYPSGGSPSIVVAVIDTGVDYTHIDLVQNMWINPNEVAGNGRDDDGNGFIDDIHGVSVVGPVNSHSGNPMDDHGHGTHVAGIIAATNNKEGIVGVAYNTQIMAIKAGQSSGHFNQADIAEAILYAYENGADIINMSFGGNSISIAVQEALMVAYSRCILIASAGNDGKPNEGEDAVPNYPAAYSYVLGVMSVDIQGKESIFSNWDSQAYNHIEYELYAPGEGILSTLPNNAYAAWSGTSMAAPVVSGIAALIRTVYSDRELYSNRFIMGQLAASSNIKALCLDPDAHGKHNLPKIVNAYSALTTLPKPNVNVSDYFIFDYTSIDPLNNEDNIIDAGEVIDIALILKNHWGAAEDIVISVDALSPAGIENPYLTFLTNDISYGAIGTYATKDLLVRDGSIVVGANHPFRIKISKNTPNDSKINININGVMTNGLDLSDEEIYTFSTTITLLVRNGIILPNIIDQDMTLTKDNYYIIPNAMLIRHGATVIVEAGTQIQFWSNDPEGLYDDLAITYIRVEGSFITQGTVDEPVELFPSELMNEFVVKIYEEGGGYVSLNYTIVTNPMLTITEARNVLFKTNTISFLKERIINYGIVDWKYATSTIDAEMIHSSIFSVIKANVRGPVIDCIFSHSAIDLSYNFPSSARDNNGYFENNVFLINNNIHYSGNSVSSISLDSSFSSYVLDGYFDHTSGHSYYRLYIHSWMEDSFNYYNSVERFANSLGGYLMSIDTQEEKNFIQQNFPDQPFYSGLFRTRSGDFVWKNGNPMSDLVGLTHDSHGYVPLERSTDADNRANVIVIELPHHSHSVEEVTEAFNQFVSNGYFTAFYHNAFLNNFNDTNVNQWLRFVAENEVTDNSLRFDSIGLGGNYWGTTDSFMINRQIFDFDDFQHLMDIDEGKILETAPETAFPFVVDIELFDQNDQKITTVGNELVKFVVHFNRDMDTSVPLMVSYGSALPFAEHHVPGQYETPRKWVGYYQVSTLMNNGNQFFSIRNGHVENDPWFTLQPDLGRFTFRIDTTSAQAMIMQAIATETGISISWDQDDFDTLAGYNLYRSTSEDGFYQRLNQTVIPVDVKTFFDEDIEPGVIYYYNFTVVKTDLTESIPSGKIVVQSMDTMAPNIYHTPVFQAFTNQNLIISALITDNLMVQEANLYYRTVGTEPWTKLTMTNHNDRYSAIVYSDHLSLDGLEYYIEAFDGISYTYKGTPGQPLQVIVKLAVNPMDFGDVNGDGSITVLDALMVLQAINDLINLDADQFLRADLNGNGVLEAWEALRILQYVSGKVTSIMPD